MPQLLVLYATPPDPAAFDKHYTETHIPLAGKLPGLTKYELSESPVPSPTGPSGFHLAATLHFPDMATLQSAMSSPESIPATADAATLMAPGSMILILNNHEV